MKDLNLTQTCPLTPNKPKIVYFDFFGRGGECGHWSFKLFIYLFSYLFIYLVALPTKARILCLDSL